MSNTKPDHDHASSWKVSLSRQADLLERHADATRLIAIADTPLDGLAVALDLAMAAAHQRDGRRGASSPPAPISKLLTRFASALRDKLGAIGVLLTSDERDRLVAIAPRVLASVEARDEDVVDVIAQLIREPPEIIACWLQLHLREIEARFAMTRPRTTARTRENPVADQAAPPAPNNDVAVIAQSRELIDRIAVEVFLGVVAAVQGVLRETPAA